MPARSLNLGILAHVDAGKTTLTERLLHLAGVIDQPGSVDSGTTRTDSLAVERRRGITVKAAVVALQVDDITVNVVDTPGHPDFIAEVERALGVLDGAVLVLSAVEGVQPQTRILMRALQRQRIPTLLFVNKIDRAGADVARVLEQVRSRLTPDVLVTGAPVGLGSAAASFAGFAREDPAFQEREMLALAEHDDGVLAAYVEGRERSAADLQRVAIAQTRAGVLHPVYAGSAATGAGVAELMTGIVTYLPAISPATEGPPSGTVFKIERGGAGEKIAYVRLFGGAVRPRDRIVLGEGRHATIAATETFDGGAWVRTPAVTEGQIGRLHGLAAVRVGDTFGPHRRTTTAVFAPPTLEASVEAVRPAQRPALRAALLQLADSDPLIAARVDDDGRPTVSLYGRVQQEVLATTLAEEHGIDVAFSEAGVLHVERPRRAGEAVLRLNTEENPYQATIGLRLEPAPPGSGLRLVSQVPARDMPLYLYKSAETFVATIERHVRQELAHGRYGWTVTDCVVTLVEAAYSVADGPPSRRGPTSTASDYRNVTPLVAREALDRAGTRVCEPVLRIRLEVPLADAPTLNRLLARWGAGITRQTSAGGLARLEARLVAARLHALQHQLPDLTGGEGTLEWDLDGYQPVVGEPPVRAGWRARTAGRT
ncbi:MAG TPA: GTP-binding protein [Actinotalea caeni]|uniref:GTP-binding protein n=1 Tax=Actinotalea caeni TaxID=1348467 RepID=UPI002B4AF25C|nr:GTP-binding protein [Actinotalea caeni]HLV54807.1 GTP-binding protein [Actinotalea caeni]